MRTGDAIVTARLAALCLLTLSSASTAASDDCMVADVLVSGWIRMARANVSAAPATTATRTELAFETKDAVVLKGFSYSAARAGDGIARDFILLLQGSASSAAQLAETASRLALATGREVFVYEYRGYAEGSSVRPTAASIQRDVNDILDRLAEDGRPGVAIGLSMGGIFAIQALRDPKRGGLRVLADSVPARLPRIPFLIHCPRWMDPVDAATPDVMQRMAVVYGADDGWSRDPAADELMEKVRAGGGRVWLIEGGHVDLSLLGLAARLPIYVDFVLGRKASRQM